MRERLLRTKGASLHEPAVIVFCKGMLAHANPCTSIARLVVHMQQQKVYTSNSAWSVCKFHGKHSEEGLAHELVKLHGNAKEHYIARHPMLPDDNETHSDLPMI